MTPETRKDVVLFRINRAKETYLEAILLYENQKLNTAVNRLYYACFYAVIALLVKHEISTKTHSGAKQMFGLHFIKTGKIDAKSS